MHHITIEQFSGPLDILLSLIREKKLEITTLSVSKVTEQYLQYLEQIEEKNPEELADFLVIATKVVLLKSQELLPQFLKEEEVETNIVDQLRIYKAFVDASKQLNKQWLHPHRSWARQEPPKKRDGFFVPTNMTLDEMHKSMVTLIHRIAPPKPLPKTQIDKTVSIKEKILAIRSALQENKKIYFFEVLKESSNKTERIITFLALLELVKQQGVFVSQDTTYGDISIERGIINS